MSTDLAVGGLCSVPDERRRDDADDPSAAVVRGADKDYAHLPYHADYCKSLENRVPN
jgi:hypothetical protein